MTTDLMIRAISQEAARDRRTTTVRFSIDKNGKRRAHYWGQARRWLPISIAKAELDLGNRQGRTPVRPVVA